MTAYAIGVYDIWDAGWRDGYREKTMELVAKHSGRFLVRPDCRVDRVIFDGKRATIISMASLKGVIVDDENSFCH